MTFHLNYAIFELLDRNNKQNHRETEVQILRDDETSYFLSDVKDDEENTTKRKKFERISILRR